MKQPSPEQALRLERKFKKYKTGTNGNVSMIYQFDNSDPYAQTILLNNAKIAPNKNPPQKKSNSLFFGIFILKVAFNKGESKRIKPPSSETRSSVQADLIQVPSLPKFSIL